MSGFSLQPGNSMTSTPAAPPETKPGTKPSTPAVQPTFPNIPMPKPAGQPTTVPEVCPLPPRK